ncbi:TRAP dicarboxylate transporter, DctQ subunit, unknown substrate 7 [plant metagenome]|uniref:Tripartite ATP-independent periplasmic transporters DctQ component domain-containing protein n=1 Tax=plant metagenome TaxID=1297885 RepID=A0A484TKL2_9ZZZZ
MSFLSNTRALLARISRASALSGLYLLFLTALGVSADVLVRKLFGIAFVGTDELGGYVMAIATSWALSYAFLEGAHIRVNVIHMTLRPAPKAWLDILAAAVTAVIIGLLAWQVWIIAFESWEFDAVSNTPLRLPLWIPQFMFLGGIVLFLLSAVVVLLESLSHAIHGRYEQASSLSEEQGQVEEYTS